MDSFCVGNHKINPWFVTTFTHPARQSIHISKAITPYPISILAQRLEYTAWYYSGIRGILLEYSACTSAVFGTKTGVVPHEDSHKTVRMGYRRE